MSHGGEAGIMTVGGTPCNPGGNLDRYIRTVNGLMAWKCVSPWDDTLKRGGRDDRGRIGLAHGCGRLESDQF